MNNLVWLVTAPNRRLPVDAFYDQEKANDRCRKLNDKLPSGEGYYQVISIIVNKE